MKLRVLVSAIAAALLAVPLLLTAAPPAAANHSWGPYHWARTSNPFTLKLGDNVSASSWDSYLGTTSSDWTLSNVLDTTIVGGGTSGRRCRATSGRVEVCSSAYGNNGWLGLAQIWITGGVHIAQGVVKVNDSYFNTATYNTPAWRNLVMCQEVGHTFGLGHQDETFGNANLGTCMDYTSLPSTNQHPNQHDYDQLVTIYQISSQHSDTSTTVSQTTASSGPGRSGTAADEGPNNPADFGRPVGPEDNYGRDILFVKELPDGRKLFTHVFWALPGSGPGAPPRR